MWCHWRFQNYEVSLFLAHSSSDENAQQHSTWPIFSPQCSSTLYIYMMYTIYTAMKACVQCSSSRLGGSGETMNTTQSWWYCAQPTLIYTVLSWWIVAYIMWKFQIPCGTIYVVCNTYMCVVLRLSLNLWRDVLWTCHCWNSAGHSTQEAVGYLSSNWFC